MSGLSFMNPTGLHGIMLNAGHSGVTKQVINWKVQSGVDGSRTGWLHYGG